MQKLKISKKLAMAVAYVKEQIDGCDEMIRINNNKRKNDQGQEIAFGYWAESHAEVVINNETIKDYWHSVLAFLVNFTKEVQGKENDKLVLKALVSRRQDWISRIVRWNGNHSANQMANLIEEIRQNALKHILGETFYSGNSLTNLIYQWEHFDDKTK